MLVEVTEFTHGVGLTVTYHVTGSNGILVCMQACASSGFLMSVIQAWMDNLYETHAFCFMVMCTPQYLTGLALPRCVRQRTPLLHVLRI